MIKLIKHILKEETENIKINSIVEMIRALFNDVVVDIEVGEIRKKPFIRVQIKTDDPAVNIDNWYAQQMVDIISDYTGGNIKLMPWWSPLRRDEVFDAYLDVNKKLYDYEGNAIKESKIKEHPRSEEFEKYKGILDAIVYQFVHEDEICGYGTEYFLNAGEDAVRIVLYYKDGKFPGIGTHMKYAKDIKSMAENYLPIVNMAFVAFDSTACKKRITENVDEIEKNLKVIRNILKQVSWEGLCDIWVEYNYLDKDYEIRSKSKLQDEVSPLPEIQKEFDFLDNTLRSMGLRTYIFTPWYVENCEDEVEFLNESKDDIQKNLSAIREILKTISWNGLCDIWVNYNKEDRDYEIRSKSKAYTSQKESDEIEKELTYLDDVLRSFKIQTYIFTPWYVENCEDEVEFLD